jgi:hypothetical protein
LLTLAASVLVGYRFLWRGRFRADAAVPLLGSAVARHEPRASLLELRRRSMLHSGNVWEAVHQLARQVFETAGVPPADEALPLVLVGGGWWQRRRVKRRVARLWKLARGETPVRIPPAALRHWLRDLEELKTALSDGTIGLTGAGRSPGE